VERSAPSDCILLVHLGSRIEEEACHLHMSVKCSPMQRRETAPVKVVDVGASLPIGHGACFQSQLLHTRTMSSSTDLSSLVLDW
jgi:hypothetical protein